MEYEQFRLKWNNFQANILTAFESLQTTEDLADVTLACEGTTVKAHKFILSACSPYFRNIFKENPCSHPVVILKDVSHIDLISLLSFIYHGEVMVTKEQLPTFLKTAEALQISGLKSLPDLYPRKKVKRLIQESEAEVHKKSKVNKEVSNHEQKSHSNKSTNVINVENIKVEAEDEAVEENGAESKTVSLLEATLEIKDPGPQASILERSLTHQASSSGKSPNPAISSKESIIANAAVASPKSSDVVHHRKLDDLVKQEVVDCDAGNSSDNQSSDSSAGLRTETPAHHSSQCGSCPHCGLPYSNQSSLKYHVRLVHSELLNLYCCHLCPLTFGYRDSYKKHMADAHSVRT